MRIMIVDDDPISRAVLVKVLQDIGTYDEIANGTEAIQAFEASVAGKDRYDLITLDISMPDISGLTVLYKMRKIEDQYQIDDVDRAKIVMVTADDKREHIKTAIAEKCTYYIVKPFNKNEVLEKFKRQKIIS